MSASGHKPGGGAHFNLSRWALDHVALTRYFMVVLMLLGFAAYFQLGQDEDPPFTFRAMVIRTYWPGATAEQVAQQVTDKIERTLQEVPYADKISSYSKPGSRRSSSSSRTPRPPRRCPSSGTRCARKSATCATPCLRVCKDRFSMTTSAMSMA